jgi:ribose-phosphate pyrophosphokinase
MDQVAGGGATPGSGAGVYGFPESEGPARRLAQALSLPCRVAVIHRFPDGERLVRLAHVFDHAILYRSLNDPALKDPDDKLVELLFAASALRDHGTRRLTLVAPYLSYMRQDIAFHPGEAVSQKVMGRLLGDAFDRVFTVDPHLHRTGTLAQVLPGAEAQALSAAPALARLLGDDPPPPDALLVGPDTESRALVSGVAEPLGLDWAVGDKLRRGDRAVTIRLPEALRLHGRPVILVDDAVSTGATLMECARLVLTAGAGSVEAVVVHALFPPGREGAFRKAGISRLRSTDSLAHPSNAVPLAPLFAEALA